MAGEGARVQKIADTAGGVVLAHEKDGRQVMVQVTYPDTDKSVLGQITNATHTTLLKNDIYETARVDCELKCRVEPVDQKPTEAEYEYVCESYDAYLASKMHISNQDFSARIYGDEDFCLYEAASSVGKPVLWHCRLYSTVPLSIRELQNLEVLKRVRQTIYEVLHARGVKKEHLCLYFDYTGKSQPMMFYVADISNGLNVLKCSGKFVYFDTLIQNLALDRNYYRRDISYTRLKKGSPSRPQEQPL